MKTATTRYDMILKMIKCLIFLHQVCRVSSDRSPCPMSAATSEKIDEWKNWRISWIFQQIIHWIPMHDILLVIGIAILSLAETE